jgi:hypothetical protein
MQENDKKQPPAQSKHGNDLFSENKDLIFQEGSIEMVGGGFKTN